MLSTAKLIVDIHTILTLPLSSSPFESDIPFVFITVDSGELDDRALVAFQIHPILSHVLAGRVSTPTATVHAERFRYTIICTLNYNIIFSVSLPFRSVVAAATKQYA
jgi:hypothetical protein